MTVTKKIFPLLLAVLVLAGALLALAVPASAATQSNGTRTQTITVTTKANWWIPGSESITLGQTKGVCQKSSYNFFTRKSTIKTYKVYGEWDIVAKATDGSHTVRKTLSGSSVKIPLKPNKTYQITVSWDHTAATLTQLSKGNFTQYPTWRVKSTYKVSQYY